MVLSHRFRPRYLIALAIAALLGATVPADAQPPRFPPGARGYQKVQIMQQHLRQKALENATRTTRPARPEPRYVTVQGPDGRVRTFRLDAEIIRTYRPRETGPQYVTVRESTGRARTFAIEGEIIRVNPGDGQ